MSTFARIEVHPNAHLRAGVFALFASLGLGVAPGCSGEPSGGAGAERSRDGAQGSAPARADEGAPSSLPPGATEGIDRNGGDYRDFDLERPDPHDCQRACLADERCRAWTYVKPGAQAEAARCWLKDQVPDPHPDECCVSGVRVHERETTLER